MSSVAMTRKDGTEWDELRWKRRIETFGRDDGPVVTAGPSGDVDGVWRVTHGHGLKAAVADQSTAS